MKRVIGLYGGSGAGKSSVARWLAGRGALVIDADAVSREVSAPGGSAYTELRQAFADCFTGDGVLNRRALGSRVFADEAERLRLEAIVHPHMRRRIEEMIAGAPGDLVVLDCAVLLRPAFRDLADELWLVRAPADERRRRIEARDHLRPAQARERLAAQETDADLARFADQIIENSGTQEQLAARLEHQFGHGIANEKKDK